MFRAPMGLWLCASGDLDNAKSALLFLRQRERAMGEKDPRVDAYIKAAAPFARPILAHLRKVVHAGCPEVEESIKWRMPYFNYKGIFIGIAAFKQHCAFGFWREAELALEGVGVNTANMGHFGRITSLDDLPDEKTLIGYVRKAKEIKDSGLAKPSASRKRRDAADLEVPPDLAVALKKNANARKAWEQFSYSHRKEYIEWITGAKREETRKKRLATALDQIAEGKSQNWRYAERK